MAYAEGTEVSVEKSRAEVERLVTRYGASEFMSGWGFEGRAVVAFKASERYVRFELRLPDRSDKKIRFDGRGHLRSEGQIVKALDGETRRRWRALVLVLKAKLESVESKVETFENAFMAQIVMPGGRTVSELLAEPIAEAYRTGRLPTLLPALPAMGETS